MALEEVEEGKAQQQRARRGAGQPEARGAQELAGIKAGVLGALRRPTSRGR